MDFEGSVQEDRNQIYFRFRGKVYINPVDEASWITVSGRPVPDVSGSSGCSDVLVFD